MSDTQHQLAHHETRWQQQQHPLIIACDNWHDPLNVGMLFRLAEGYGLEALWLGGSTPCPPNRKIKKTARSTVQRVPYQDQPELVAALQEAKDRGYLLVGVEITDRSFPLREYLRTVPHQQATVLVLGSENGGISPAVIACLDVCVHLPMYGHNTSLNVMMATAIAVENWVESVMGA